MASKPRDMEQAKIMQYHPVLVYELLLCKYSLHTEAQIEDADMLIKSTFYSFPKFSPITLTKLSNVTQYLIDAV